MLSLGLTCDQVKINFPVGCLFLRKKLVERDKLKDDMDGLALFPCTFALIKCISV
jgi:hypothetical protein